MCLNLVSALVALGAQPCNLGSGNTKTESMNTVHGVAPFLDAPPQSVFLAPPQDPRTSPTFSHIGPPQVPQTSASSLHYKKIVEEM